MSCQFSSVQSQLHTGAPRRDRLTIFTGRLFDLPKVVLRPQTAPFRRRQMDCSFSTQAQAMLGEV